MSQCFFRSFDAASTVTVTTISLVPTWRKRRALERKEKLKSVYLPDELARRRSHQSSSRKILIRHQDSHPLSHRCDREFHLFRETLRMFGAAVVRFLVTRHITINRYAPHESCVRGKRTHVRKGNWGKNEESHLFPVVL